MKNPFFLSSINIFTLILILLFTLMNTADKIYILIKRKNSSYLIFDRFVLTTSIFLGLFCPTPCMFPLLSFLFLIDTIYSRLIEKTFDIQSFLSISMPLILVMRIPCNEFCGDTDYFIGNTIGYIFSLLNILLLSVLLYELNEKEKRDREERKNGTSIN